MAASARERHLRLLELESLISDASSGRPSSSASSSGGQQTRHEPIGTTWQPPRQPTPPVVRANYIQPTAPPGRPNSAGRRPGPPAGPDVGYRAPSQDRSLPGDFEALCDLIGSKAAARYRTVGQAMRHIDKNHNSMVDRSEIHSLFRQFNLPPEYADRFFDQLRCSPEEMDPNTLEQIIGPYIMPGYRDPRWAVPARSSSRLSLQERNRKAEVEEMTHLIGTKAHQRFRNPRECFRSVDDDKDGRLSRTEVVRFVERLGLPRSTANHVFNELLDGGEGDGTVSFLKFMETFGPIIQPGYYKQTPAYAHGVQMQRASDAAAGYNERLAPRAPTRPQAPPPRARSASVRRRPSSARGARPAMPQTAGAGGLRAARAAVAFPHTRDKSPDVASLASVSTRASSSNGSYTGVMPTTKRAGYKPMYSAPKVPSTSDRGDEGCASDPYASMSSSDSSWRKRGEVYPSLRGATCFIQEPKTPPVHTRTYDSSNMRNRLGEDRSSTVWARPLNSSRSWGPSAWKAAMSMHQEPHAGYATEPTLREKLLEQGRPFDDAASEDWSSRWRVFPHDSSVVGARTEVKDYSGEVILTPGHRGTPTVYVRNSSASSLPRQRPQSAPPRFDRRTTSLEERWRRCSSPDSDRISTARAAHPGTAPQDGPRGRASRGPGATWTDHRGTFNLDLCACGADSVARCIVAPM